MKIEDHLIPDSGAESSSDSASARASENVDAHIEETPPKKSVSAASKATGVRRERATTRGGAKTAASTARRTTSRQDAASSASASQVSDEPSDTSATNAETGNTEAGNAEGNSAASENAGAELVPLRETPLRETLSSAAPQTPRTVETSESSTRLETPQLEMPLETPPREESTSREDPTVREDSAPRAVRLPEVRDERRPEVRSLEARSLETRGDRGLRFRGREGRAELRRTDARGFRNRYEGRDGNGNGSNNGSNRDSSNRDSNNRDGGNRDGNNNRNENRNSRGDANGNNSQQGRLQGQRGDGRNDNRNDARGDSRNDNRNDGRDQNRDQPRDENYRVAEPRGAERDSIRGQNDLDLTTLEDKNLSELRDIAKELNVPATATLKKSDLVLRILEAQAEVSGNLFKKGILEILPDGKGFLRTEGYLSSNEDVYISQSQIKRFNLKTGDIVSGQVRAPKEMERYYGLLRVEACNGEAPDISKSRKEFEKLTPIFPNEKFKLETTQENITARIIDLVSPIGKGQRGLIVAPPKAGKTTLIKNIANSIMENHPDVYLIVLLIDERPEEVTDIARSVRGEVVASTFDELPENHMRVADMVMEKAKRMVEQKKDVIVLLDSITRLSRASNLVVNPSGRTMSGGLDPAAMYRPKRMFGAARNIEEGGSLTILATALVDTGSRMDDYIFEEFKGTGNMDLVLDRSLFDQRIFPAIDINKSGTRRDDLLLSKEDLAATYHLRRTLSALDNDKAINLLIDRLRNTKTNSDFMAIVQKSSRQQSTPTQAP